MKFCRILVALAFLPYSLAAQDQPDEATGSISALDQQIADLEAKLNQTLDTSPLAAITMLQLIDVYYKEGRAFGLVSTGRRFINAQPEHPKHKEVMIKLIDGFLVTARNQDMINACRQFAATYPDADETAEIERQLAETLDRTGKRDDAARAWASAYKRKNGTIYDAGRAISIYRELNNGKAHSEAAQIGLELLNKVQGSIAARVANVTFDSADRSGDRRLAIQAGTQILAKNPPITNDQRFDLYTKVSSHYWNEDQKANTIKGRQAALQIKKDEPTHRYLVDAMHQIQTKPGEMKTVVDQYLSNFPDSQYRGSVLGLLAHAYSREKDDAKAAEVAAQAMLEDAYAHSMASQYVRWAASGEDKYPEIEAKLKEALEKTKDNKWAVNYALAFDLYRDRMKDTEKAREYARKMIQETPVDTGHVHNAMNYLLDGWKEDEDDQFKGDAKLILDAVKKYPEYSYYTGYFKEKSAAYKKDREKWRKQRANLLGEHAKTLQNDVTIRNWGAYQTRGNKGIDAREELAKQNLSDNQAKKLLGTHAYHFRHYERDKKPSAKYYGILSDRFPKDHGYANSYLEAANGYGDNDSRIAAIKRILSHEPEGKNSGLWRNLLDAAEKVGDKSLFPKILEWINKAEELHGIELSYAADIGDRLSRNDLKGEAKKWWERHVNVDPNSDENRYLAERLLGLVEEQDAKIPVLELLLKEDSRQQGAYAAWLADIHFKKKEYAKMEQVLKTAKQRKDKDPLIRWTLWDQPAFSWIDNTRPSQDMEPESKARIYKMVRDVEAFGASGAAIIALLEVDSYQNIPVMQRLKFYRDATLSVSNHTHNFDKLMSYAQAAQGRKDYAASAALLTNMLANITAIDSPRKDKARNMVTQAYSRMGAIGITIDENSPLAPLLQIGLQLRLGDEESALDTYNKNQDLFDKHRHEIPVDIVLFAARRHVLGGGQENHDRAEDILRSWLVQNGESKQYTDVEKAKIQLLLADNYNKAANYDIARNEYLSVINQYKETEQATEAKFGVGETYMAQKIYDKAEEIFEELSNSRFHRVMIRAEFLRGVLAHRQEDRDTAREIFRNVLEKMPDAQLANETLFNLAEVYGVEQRYKDQLDLLRTVGRLGQRSKRWHTPGMALSIVVQDGDLGISRGHTKIPVVITTEPGQDSETAFLVSGGAGKGLFMTEIPTILGKAVPNSQTLELKGGDVIKVDYPEAFKNEFKFHILSNNEIHVAADADFYASSSKIVIEEEETFTQELNQESVEENQDLRRSIDRPENQIKPGNVVYLRVDDGDRNISDGPDMVPVKLVATSGDEVTVDLQETEAHSGIFEGTVETSELPAGALASDTGIEYNPLMAIDHDEATMWKSEPDGATPKWLSIDLKDINPVSSVILHTPNADDQAPLRVTLQGSHDGRFWYKVASYPATEAKAPLASPEGIVRIPRQSQWKFFDEAKAPPAGWKSKEFDDTSWKFGAGPLGYGQIGEINPATETSFGSDPEAKPLTTYFRQTFNLAYDPSTPVKTLTAKVMSDDGFVLYLNGKEVARDNMPAGDTNHEMAASSARGDEDEGVYQTFGLSVDTLVSGINTLAAEVHQNNASSSDLAFDLELSYTSDAMPEGVVQRVYKVEKPAEFGSWESMKNLVSNNEPVSTSLVQDLSWKLNPDGLTNEALRETYAVVWQGKFIQERDGAVRFEVGGQNKALMLDGELVQEPLAPAQGQNRRNQGGGRGNNQGIDAYVKRGIHDLAIVSVTNSPTNGVTAERARENPNSPAVNIRSFRKSDFYPTTEILSQFKEEAQAQKDVEAVATVTSKEENKMNFAFAPRILRFVKFQIHEYIGEAVAVNHVQVLGPERQYIPTESDVLELANNKTLEITPGDTVTASYIDELTAGGQQRNRLLTKSLSATYFDADIDQLAYEFRRSENGEVTQIELELLRIDPGERIILEVTDFDMDETADIDSIPVEVQLNNDEPLHLVATEIDTFAGIFRTEIDTRALDAAPAAPAGNAPADAGSGTPAEPAGNQEAPVLAVKPGDQIRLSYLDRQNTFPGHKHHRETIVYVNAPTQAKMQIVETRNAINEGTNNRTPTYLGPNLDAPATYINGIAYEMPLTVEVIDPDQAKNSGSKVMVEITTGINQKHMVECALSYNFRAGDSPEAEIENPALHAGRFIGQMVLNLGSTDSPSLVPQLPDMPKNLTGRVIPPETPEGDTMEVPQGSIFVLNLTGPDVVHASYTDKIRPVGADEEILGSKARLVTDATLAITDADYEYPTDVAHLGDKAYVLVIDPDMDASEERDKIQVTITTERGEEETVQLEETLSHSGAFSGAFKLTAVDRPTPGSDDGKIEAFFGETMTVSYRDTRSSSIDEQPVHTATAKIAIGTNGLVSSFSKVFENEDLAIQTQFHIAESFFELFKSHLDLGREDEAKHDLTNGLRVLRELIEDYPNPKYAARVSYLRGQFAQELKNWNEAIDAYEDIIRNHGESSLASDAQYKLAQCYEEADRFDDALEAYVTLASTYPDSPLIANVMVRINEYFYKNENFPIAAQVGKKFTERFQENELAPKMAFRVGQCFYKSEDYKVAGQAFDEFVKNFPDDKLASEALFWSGESYRMGNNVPEAFRRYNRCRWDFPESDAAKYARGRLALPEMLEQFQREANVE